MLWAFASYKILHRPVLTRHLRVAGALATLGAKAKKKKKVRGRKDNPEIKKSQIPAEVRPLVEIMDKGVARGLFATSVLVCCSRACGSIVRCTALHCTVLCSTALCCTALHCAALCSTLE